MRSPIEETEGAIERLGTFYGGTFYGGIGVVEEHEMRMRAREVKALEDMAQAMAMQAAQLGILVQAVGELARVGAIQAAAQESIAMIQGMWTRG